MVHLFFTPEYAQFQVFSNTCVSLTTSHCHSVGFCIALCVVSALNSQGLYFHCKKVQAFTILFQNQKPCQNYFQIIFTENKMKPKRKINESSLAFLKISKVFLSTLLSIFECKQVSILYTNPIPPPIPPPSPLPHPPHPVDTMPKEFLPLNYIPLHPKVVFCANFNQPKQFRNVFLWWRKFCYSCCNPMSVSVVALTTGVQHHRQFLTFPRMHLSRSGARLWQIVSLHRCCHGRVFVHANPNSTWWVLYVSVHIFAMSCWVAYRPDITTPVDWA